MRPYEAAFIAVAVAVAVWLGVSQARGAEQHPAMTADVGPGWRVHECQPDQPCRWRGRVFDTATGCSIDLWSVANTAPKGTRTACVKVDSKHKVAP